MIQILSGNKVMVIKEQLFKIKQYARWIKRLWHPFKKTAYLLATPTHDNIGDLGIVVAEEKFLKECGYKKVVIIIMGDCWEYPRLLARLLPRHAPVYLQGGGNMGDIYLDEQLRRIMFLILEKHDVVLFPETLFYRDTIEGNKEKTASIQYYNKKNITIAARELPSYKMMRNLYPQANVILTPDIVLSLPPQIFRKNRNGILLCFRNDQEKYVTQKAVNELQSNLEKKGYLCAITSMIYYKCIVAGMWENVVKEKMEEIASARLLITDRLHGMIFAALTQTPCIVLGNNNHKVEGVYQWIKDLLYIYFAKTIIEAEEAIDDMYQLDKCTFTFNKENFSEFKRLIQEKGRLI